MWSSFEKLKDNITQIASEVLESQEELDNESLDGSESNYHISSRPSGLSDNHDNFEAVPLSEDMASQERHTVLPVKTVDPPCLYKYENGHHQTDEETASTKFAALLEDKEMEVSMLREENSLLKEQVAMITARQVTLDGTNKELDIQLAEKEHSLMLMKEIQEKTWADCERLKEQLNVEKAIVVSTGTQYEELLDDVDAALNNLDVSGTEKQEVMALSQQLKATEEACLLHKAEFQKKVEDLSLERDKAQQNLGRLRQNLLDMEASTSEKMDNDSLLISNLESRLELSEGHAALLQQSLNHTLGELAELKEFSTSRSNHTEEEIELLRQRLETCIAALESKDLELSNLQSALGQYYAESDAQERLELELHEIKQSNYTLTEELKVANEAIDSKVKDLDSAMTKAANAETLMQELEQHIRKKEEEVIRLRRALEQSITSLNRMSTDSDFYVDRRIVIKLLVTYFQRHHSKEVLDLMVRMLGFSEEDKQRVGLAQQNARGGVVRGVWNLPSRMVGGILKSDFSSPPAAAENGSFADSWIDFLLESEQRERREKEGGAANSHTMSLNGIASRSTPSSPTGGHHRSKW